MNAFKTIFRERSARLALACAAAAILATEFFSASLAARNAVDVHAHFIPPEYTECLREHGAEAEETFPLPSWDEKNHVAFMDSAGIECSVLSLPAPHPYFGNAEECAKIVRRTNEAAAKIRRENPRRFRFLATLPLPDVPAAVEEAKYAIDVLGADGVKLASNSRGQYVGDAELDPLMEVLNERGAVVFIHPHRPTPFSEKIASTTPFPMLEYPAETTRAVANLLAREVPKRFPNVKIVVPHCGSFLPLAIPRMKSILPAMTAAGLMAPIDWDANLARLYYDTAGNPTPDVLRALLTITTPDHVLYGSDFPYLPDAVLRANLEKFKAALAADAELAPFSEMLLRGNAEKLFEKNSTRKGNPQ